MAKTISELLFLSCYLVAVQSSTFARLKENHMSKKGQKRTSQGLTNVDSIANPLTKALLSSITDKASADEFAFLYLDSQMTVTPSFDNSLVANLLNSPTEMLPSLINRPLWPHDANFKRLPSNLVVAGVDNRFGYHGETLAIDGHSEHRVLQELTGMLMDFKKTHGKCPNFVILGTARVPCHDVTMKLPSCTTEVFQKRLWLSGPQGGNCPHTKFVVGYNSVPPYMSNSWPKAMEFLHVKGITVVAGSDVR